MKYILSTDALLYCARSTDAYKATLFDVELILHGGWISKWMSRILCAHCTAYKGIRKQCKWVLSTDIVQNNTISQQSCEGRNVCCDGDVAEDAEEGERIWYHNNHFWSYSLLKRMTVLQVVFNSCSILFLPSNASGANYTTGLQPKKFRFQSKSFIVFKILSPNVWYCIRSCFVFAKQCIRDISPKNLDLI